MPTMTAATRAVVTSGPRSSLNKPQASLKHLPMSIRHHSRLAAGGETRLLGSVRGEAALPLRSRVYRQGRQDQAPCDSRSYDAGRVNAMHMSLTTRLHDSALSEARARHEKMMAEARRIIDEGNSRGLTVRLTGGLAVRHYAIDLDFAEREYSDIDLIGLRRQSGELHGLFSYLGYVENLHVAMATGNGQRQYFTPRDARIASHMLKRRHYPPVLSAVPPTDHIDVFLDAMRMDHEIDLRDRLDINTYAIDPADLFLCKLQIVRLNEKDVHDVITLCKDVYVDFQPHPGVLDLQHVAETCADDWGLYIDVMSNIDIVLERLGGYELYGQRITRVRRTLELAQDMMTEHSKTPALAAPRPHRQAPQVVQGGRGAIRWSR